MQKELSVSSPKRNCWHFLVILGVSAVVFFDGFHCRSLWTSGEDRTAQIAVEMVEGGHWVIPHLNNEVTLTKPPLLPWLIALCYKLFGTNEFSARLPSVLAATSAVLVIYFFARKFWDETSGLLSAVVLATSIEFSWHARTARIDMLFTFLVLMSLTSFYRAYICEKPSWKHFLPFYAFMALAALAKGPAGFLLPLLTVLVFLGLKKDFSGMREVFCWQGLLLFLAIALPWHMAIVFQAPRDKVTYFFLGQLSEWTGGKARRPTEPPYKYLVYLAYLAKGFFPWVFYLPASCIGAVKKWRQSRDAGVLFLLVWLGVGLVGFSLFPTRAARYILPIYPAAAMLVALVWSAARTPDAGELRRWLFRITVMVVVIWILLMLTFTAAVFVGQAGGAHIGVNGLQKLVGKRFRYIVTAPPGLRGAELVLLATGFVVLGIASIAQLKRKKVAAAFALLLLLALTQQAFVTHQVLPGIERYYNVKGFAREVNRQVRQEDDLAFIGKWHSWMRFYLGRHVERILPKDLLGYLEDNEGAYCLMASSAYDRLPEEQRLTLKTVTSCITEGKTIYLVSAKH